MKEFFWKVRRRLDAMPMWQIVALNVGVFAVWMLDFRIPDEIPIDKIVIGGMFLGTGFYLWRRFFGPPSALSASLRRRISEMEALYSESRTAAAQISDSGEVAMEIGRLGDLLAKVRVLSARVEQAEVVLQDARYSEDSAAKEVERLQKAVDAADAKTKPDLLAAFEEARAHQANVGKIRGTRDQLAAAFERFYQLFRRIHSQVLGLRLSQGNAADLVGSIDELAKALAELEAEGQRKAAADAEADAIVDRELAAAKDAEEAKLKALREQASKREKMH